ncbi:MAG: hypothetical protein A3F94_01745 [Candidatus Spechtbacteria bacterium RIFCSPLOWO2_12_FULL_38_22]|uniref:SpoVR protein-like N-terminal domain-containing protein n=1 Tax=Candidatus Spechtbacteria bacterium RIFCSPLOWO2_12_FULL_38_22 TaxID=1802165 RepID=A0A1G2HIZ5_9BACT|nr:MAG: hypothetical protein A2728_01250 [Candidatus Spechtbacteria bacterium RIFCSPHIGHO2_01_FULL_38_11]OGZ60289.1 MAG: hypothetical protein A3E58_01260 [Candidatus Spechtbacteria bacterium RIFCSPHIGHO2_12_FULL_38_30]OGZ60708.1 MAG: hypothetical protein A3A00_01630 [Candidatus Spechtbacteria bacterium RIFCSPLOWO2_01_FULL_38_20]OGZ62486.1 MAG: hypothetical protein A3F94_01745 [Candidatus Spechtbacteria bacterium RIFCSPLOWO2_12_FULL_38_22]
MNDQELRRLQEIDKRVKEIASENGLITTDILFELVSPQRMIEAMAYNFPTNYSSWDHGRDYDRQRTIYDYSGTGIPYEVVWNFNTPRAFLVDTNPFALNVLILCHVYAHVDFFLGSTLLQKSRAMGDMAQEAREAEKRFRGYEAKYGRDELERTIEAAKAIQWLQDPDPYAQDVDEEELRQHLIRLKQEELRRFQDLRTQTGGRGISGKDIERVEAELKKIKYRTPVVDEHDLLRYIIGHSPKPLRDWQKDVLSVIRLQARYLGPQMRTKLLNEGWATYWHTRIMRQLFEEGLLTDEEHGIYNEYHKNVLTKNRTRFNWYRVGLHLFEYVEERWNRGQFGRKYKESEDPHKRSDWDSGAGMGREKIFEVRTHFTDRMAIEEFFTEEFMRQEELYIWGEMLLNDEVVYVIIEDDLEKIRKILLRQHTLYNIPLIFVKDGNAFGSSGLYLVHEYTGFELNEVFETGALEYVQYLWGKTVNLETILEEEDLDEEGGIAFVPILHSYNGKSHKVKVLDQTRNPRFPK